jgi:hypothetical protein
LSGLLYSHRYDEARVELEHTTLENFLIAFIRQLLLFREHRDFERLQQSVKQLCGLYVETDCGWLVHLANRDYSAALDSLDSEVYRYEGSALMESDFRKIFSYWLMEDREQLAKGLPVWQRQLEEDRDGSGNFKRPRSYIGAAMLAGIRGDVVDAERLIQRWHYLDPIDWAHRVHFRDEACRVLGMIGAADAAVKCIRDGLEEPSYIAPFFEPYLPFYDSVRNEPVFVEMLEDIDGE